MTQLTSYTEVISDNLCAPCHIVNVTHNPHQLCGEGAQLAHVLITHVYYFW